MSSFNFTDSANESISDYVKEHAPCDQLTVTAGNVLCLKTWTSELHAIAEVEGKSQIMLGLVNELYYDRFDDRALALTAAFLRTEAAAVLYRIENQIPEAGFNAVKAEVVADIKEAVRHHYHVKALEDVLVKSVKGILERVQQTTETVVVPKEPPPAVDATQTKPPPKEPIEDAVIKTPTETPEAQAAPKVKVAFVLRGDMFPTKPGTSEYKKRYTEARSYFSKDKNLDKAVDYVVDKTELPTSFLVCNVTAEKLSEVYAQSPASVSLEDCAYGLVHKLAVLFLNTETAKSEALNDALVVIALNSSWGVVSKAPPPTEQEEILQRMNLSKAGVIADKK